MLYTNTYKNLAAKYELHVQKQKNVLHTMIFKLADVPFLGYIEVKFISIQSVIRNISYLFF